MKSRLLRRIRLSPLLLAAAVAATAPRARAAITADGDVVPADPSTWTPTLNSMTGTIGAVSQGTILVNNGSTLLSFYGHLGDGSGASGTVTIDGNGSTWLIGDPGSPYMEKGGELYVGYAGSGTLNIINGARIEGTDSILGFLAGSVGTTTVDGSNSTLNLTSLTIGNYGSGTLCIAGSGRVSVLGTTSVAPSSTATGMIVFGAGGGTLSTFALLAGRDQIKGTGTIYTSCWVSDFDAVFDSTHGPSQSVSWQNADQNVTINYTYTGTSSGYAVLGAGYTGTGSLTIRDGIVIASNNGYLGYGSGSTGFATIAGPGSSWINDYLYVGNQGTGSVLVSTGATLKSVRGYLGYNAGAIGSVTVDGVGSSWTIGITDILVPGYGVLDVGRGGEGALNITNGGKVRVYGPTTVGHYATSTGTLNFGTNGGTLTTQSLYLSPSQVTGTGTIYATGLISDCDWLFDANHPFSKTILWDDANRHVTINFVTGSGVNTINGEFGIGFQNVANLAIRDGLRIICGHAYLGYAQGSVGTATIEGAGSRWDAGSLDVGNSGSGLLNIVNGGFVASTDTYIGHFPGAAGTANVDGPQSVWNPTTLLVGYGGAGKLNILNGARVLCGSASTGSGPASGSGPSETVRIEGPGSRWNCYSGLGIGLYGTSLLTLTNGGRLETVAGGLSINNASLLTMTVGDGTAIDLRDKGLTNNATLRLKAAPSAAVGAYSPITSGTWSGTGSVQALGGAWDSVSHVFTISAAAAGSAGQDVSIDRFQTQRIAITDPTAGTLQAAFLPAAGNSTLRLNANPLADAADMLIPTLPPDASLLAAWTFTAGGYSPDDPVFLSFQVGPGLAGHALCLWQIDGDTWSRLAAPDLSYDGTYASFTVTSLTGLAVTTTVPEPTSLVLLTLGAAALVRRRHSPPAHKRAR